VRSYRDFLGHQEEVQVLQPGKVIYQRAKLLPKRNHLEVKEYQLACQWFKVSYVEEGQGLVLED